MTSKKPLIKQGWLRALLYVVATMTLMMAISSYPILVGSVAVVTYLFRTFIDAQSFVSLGFNFKGYSQESLVGCCSAIAIIGIGTLILTLAGYLSFTGFMYENEILTTLFFLVIVSFIEELMFRGYLLNNLMQSMNKWIALLITAVLFTLAHTQNPNVSMVAVINVFAAGILLGINYIYTKNLWFGIFFHFAWNVMQGPVIGYEVSGLELKSLLQQSLEGPELITGGSFGFEGSIICLALIILFTTWFAFAFKRRYQFA